MSETLSPTGPTRAQSWRIGVFAALLACAGLPLYVHLPRFVTDLGLPIGGLGALLLALRVFDFVQDPLLGRLVDRFRTRVAVLAAVATMGLGGAFAIVFAGRPGPVGLAAGLAVVFTAYSLGMILLYARSVELAAGGESRVHVGLAAWRETGALAGVLLASLAPAVLVAAFGTAQGYAAFGLVMASAATAVWVVCRPLWHRPPAASAPAFAVRPFLAAGGGRLLLLALVNALPTAVTATLFLFFVEDHLRLPDLSGPFLALFFVTAGLAAPLWAACARRIGARPMLVVSMSLAIASFLWAALLPPGAAWAFAAVSAASGAAVGAELVLLPALFALFLDRNALPAGVAFGLWSFVAKFALALAAALVLPALAAAGYVPGAAPDATAGAALVLGYAVLPCAIKLVALGLLCTLPKEIF